MNNKVHLVMPMGGAGSRFSKNGYVMPKPLIEIKGKPFFYWSVMSIKKYINLEDLTFVVLQEHIDKFKIDGALLTFKADDPKYSYLQLDKNKNVIRTVEKEVISNDAICGAYYVKNKQIFLENVKEYIEKCNYKELFLSGIYNIMIKNGLIIKNFEVDFHIPFGTPEEYEDAKAKVEFEELKWFI